MCSPPKILSWNANALMKATKQKRSHNWTMSISRTFSLSKSVDEFLRRHPDSPAVEVNMELVQELEFVTGKVCEPQMDSFLPINANQCCSSNLTDVLLYTRFWPLCKWFPSQAHINICTNLVTNDNLLNGSDIMRWSSITAMYHDYPHYSGWVSWGTMWCMPYWPIRESRFQWWRALKL